MTLVTSFLLGTVSAWLRTNKALALTGIGFTLAAALLGGSRAAAASGDAAGSWLGVDFFVLNLVLYSAVFVPLERLFALRPEQPVFRRQWPVDLTYFFINSLLIEVLTILTLRPAVILFDWARVEWVRGAVASLPLRRRCWHCCWSPISPSTGCIARSTAHSGSGAFTRFTIRSSRWTGWPGPGCTWST